MSIFNDGFKWVKGAVKTAGKAAGSVPVVGDGLKAIVDVHLEPFAITADIATGGRLDRVALRSLKRQVNSAKAAAPYIAAVISFVPGVGTGVAAAVSAGAALAEGKPIDKALVEGIKGAIPGGPGVKAAFSVSEAIVAGKPVDQVAVAALPISTTQKQLLNTSLKVTRALVDGKPIDKLMLNEAMKHLPSASIKAINDLDKSQALLNKLTKNMSKEMKAKAAPEKVAALILKKKAALLVNESQEQLPKDVQKAIQIGMAVGTAQEIQAKERQRGKAAVAKLPHIGQKIVSSSDSLKAASNLLDGAGKSGLAVGVGLMQHKISERDFLSVRKALPGPERKGFDIAVSTHIGRVMTKDRPPPQLGKRPMTPAQKAAYYASIGMKGGTQEQKVAMLKTVTNKDTAPAVKEAIKHNNSILARILDYFGIN